MQPSEFLDPLNKLYLRFSRDKCIELEEVKNLLLIDYLKIKDVIYFSIDNKVCVKSLVKFALELTRLGADIETVSRILTWRDFEELISNYLEMNNYHVIKNVRFGARRYEIDVLGVNQITSMAIVVDCKHWSPGYSKRGKLYEVCRNHRLKAEEFNAYCYSLIGKYPIVTRAKYMVPVVITLTETISGFLSGTFIVPILKFSDYLANMNYYIDLLGGKSALISNKCYISA